MNKLAIIVVLFSACGILGGNAREVYNWEKDLQDRIKWDFTRTREDVVKYIKNY